MPSLTYTPAELSWAGGTATLEPIRLGYTAAAMGWTGGAPTIGPNLSTGIVVTKPRLDRLTRGQEYYDNKGRVGVQMQALWQKNVESVEGAFAGLIDQVSAIQAALDAAQAAQSTATQAAQEVGTLQSEIELANSYAIPVTGNLTASSSGTVTIDAHQRFYTASNIVDVDAGSISGLLEGVFYRIYYMDAAREGGAVVYQAATGDVVQSGATHVVGGVTIPLAGEPPSGGVGSSPPGYITDPADLR